jgi:hypothetical protein
MDNQRLPTARGRTTFVVRQQSIESHVTDDDNDVFEDAQESWAISLEQSSSPLPITGGRSEHSAYALVAEDRQFPRAVTIKDALGRTDNESATLLSSVSLYSTQGHQLIFSVTEYPTQALARLLRHIHMLTTSPRPLQVQFLGSKILLRHHYHRLGGVGSMRLIHA